MDDRVLLLPILLPALVAAALSLRRFKGRTGFCAFVVAAVFLNSALLLRLAAHPPADQIGRASCRERV